MRLNPSWRTTRNRIFIGAAIFLALVFIGGVQAGEERAHEHLVTDWSHRHAVFSTPKTLMQQFQLSRDHRYVQQWKRREAERRHGDRHEWRWHRAPEPAQQIQGDWSMDMGAGATVGAGNYPAKFSFDTASANCAAPPPPVGQQPDFVVYNTSQPGSSSQATIVAFDNLYSSCTGGTPLTYWAYNTGSSGAVVTSPVLSFDGAQVAFVQNTAGAATLVILRWKANDGTLLAPNIPATGPCTALTAPCQQTVVFSTANGDTTPLDSFSSPYYDYNKDIIYVGDNIGYLHKFTGVFRGTPTEVVSSGPNFWPANLDGPFGRLNSPVYDPIQDKILVTDSTGDLISVDATLGGVFPSGFTFTHKLASAGFDDGPIVDLTTETAYVFARADDASNVAAVFQIALPLVQNTSGIEVITSNSVTTPAGAFYIGAFDNQYYVTGGTGYLYVCSTSGTANALWQVHVESGVIDPVSAFLGPALTTANAGCSPVTEFFDGTTDRMFVSVANNALTTGPINCAPATGCLMSFSTEPVTFGPGIAPLARTSVTGGTSGIVIDNSSTTGGASQVYFTPLADQLCTTSGTTGGCAIQASQAGLL